ncbi:MAG: helix-turn-helix domain-containing protein [Haloferacaceae archaeon]
MGADTALEDVVSLLDDEYARDILAQTSIKPMSAEELSERCDASLPTVYRRVNRLKDHDLVTEQQQMDPDGHHYKTYAARLDRVVVELDEGTYEMTVDRTEPDVADRFASLVEGLR